MNRIRIGNQSAFSALTPILPFEYAVANGFDAFEWFPDRHGPGEGWDESDIDSETRSYIRDTALKHNITLSVHASLMANPHRPETRELIFKDIDFAQDIGATLLNIHLLTEQGIDNYIKAVKPVIMRTAEADIRLSIENTPLTGPEAFNSLFTLLKKQRSLTSSHVGMCLDLGHANLYDATRNAYLRFIDLLEPHVSIIHIHLHENYGDSDSHLPFFTGPAGKDTSGVQEFVDRMKRHDFFGSVILEQWPEPPLLLNEARDRLYYMFNSS
jgi:sugar phosphate isomerase/epimerase